MRCTQFSIRLMLLILSSITLLFAQGDRGAITGVITDKSGQPFPTLRSKW